MTSRKVSQKLTFRYMYALIFGLTSILPLLLFLFVLDRYGIIQDRKVALILGISMVLAVLGFLFFLRIVKQVGALARDFVKVERGEIYELGQRDTTGEFTEMALIADAFNKTLTDLKAHTRELENLVGKITTLSELTELVSRIPDIKEVLRTVLHRTMAAVNARIGSIMLLDDKSQTLSIATAEGLDESIVTKTTIPLGEGIAGKVAQSGEAILVEDIEKDSRFHKANAPKYGTSSFICMPLRSHWRVMGVLNLSKRGDRKAFSESDLKFLRTLLGHIGFALENARLLKEAKEAASILQQVVNEQGLQLNEVQQELLESIKLFHQAQKMEAIGTLAGGLAHDYNNILTGIQGNTSLMLLGVDSSHPHYERLKNIEQSVQRGAELTKQLLGFAMGGKYELKPTDLNELIEDQNRIFGRTKKEITIHTKYRKDIWTVEVDQGQIDQVLLNLYVNAWQAMPGGGDLYIETENITIDENFSKHYQAEPGRYVKISVIDTGVGMDEATRERIFEPFFTTKEKGRGTGLGLASVYGIIKNHGGIINVDSKNGEGTTFNIYLAASEKEVIKEKELPEELLKGTETVLLVDDEDMIIDVGKDVLKTLGYKVLPARGGKEAIEIYEKSKDKIDMVILDMIMPEMGGREVYDHLKEINPDIKVLLSSGYSANVPVMEILERGCDGFIQKPFNMKQLSQKLRDVLEKKET
ncbi:MAG: GAF domain-containing protein [Desulfobacterales bacterium]|nr:GAF domain-containing protein [Desulfobacterales bacterium]